MPDRTNKHGCVYVGAWCKLSAGGLPTYIQIQGNQKKNQSSDRQARQFLLNYIVIRTATWLCSNTYVGDAKISQGGWLRCKHATILYKERKRERTHTNTHTKKHKTRGNLFLKREEEPEGTEAKKKREIRWRFRIQSARSIGEAGINTRHQVHKTKKKIKEVIIKAEGETK